MNVNINELLKKCLFLDGQFNRYDIPLRVRASGTWFMDGRIDDLWWRMQYAKLFYWTGAEGKPYYEVVQKIEHQKMRLIDTVNLVARGISVDPIEVTEEWGLIDGSHRLSAYIAFDKKEIPVKVIPAFKVSKTAIVYYPSEWKEMLMSLYTESERCQVVRLATMMANDVKEGKWA